jgi:hypothetical protein
MPRRIVSAAKDSALSAGPRLIKEARQTRSKAFNYYSPADAACTLNCGAYCCSVGAACSL